MKEMYAQLGISSEVYDFGHKIEESLKERFEKFDKTAEYNQMKVLLAMQKNKVSAECFGSSYPVRDMTIIGRETLEKMVLCRFFPYGKRVGTPIRLYAEKHALGTVHYSRYMHVRVMNFWHQTGKPYDTLGEEVIRHPARQNGSIAESGVRVTVQVEMLEEQEPLIMTTSVLKQSYEKTRFLWSFLRFQRDTRTRPRSVSVKQNWSMIYFC